MSTLLDLLRESVLTQALLTVSITLVVLYLYVAGKAAPPELLQAWFLVVGFYFGGKVQAAIMKSVGRG